MGQLFGTDGIRGVANTAPLTAEMALAIGRATAHICKKHNRRHRIVIGKDTRISGYMIENALTAGICSMGVDVLLLGPMPTPGIAFTTRSMRADAGIVISASHNPYQDNGIKIFSRDGFKLSDKLEEEIEDLVSTGRINDIRPTADAVGRAKRIDDAIGRYIVFCKNTFPEDLTLEGLKIVIDCANGATYKVAPIIFSELGADVVAIHDKPDGRNINENCGSQYTADLSQAVKDNDADIGLAFDGDGDRLIAVDETGTETTGDIIMGTCASFMKDQSLLRKNLVIITPMTNFGVRIFFDDMKIRYKEAPVGDRNVLEMMQQNGAVLGGEQSGHIIFRNYHTTGDGIISALQLLSVMQQTGKTLSDLAKKITLTPQKLINVNVKTKPPLEALDGLQKALTEAQAQLGRKGRVLVRYSGTQFLCRVMVEGPDEKTTNTLAESLAGIVRSAIGA
ncbi:MAG: phosphoglucosamine mutase [Verrucomicrobia bacterium]|nr:phosphoglucosamine mutase [Verrucomicrobiota bacterium]